MLIKFKNETYNCIISCFLGALCLALTIFMMNGYISSNSVYFLPFFTLLVISVIFKSHLSFLLYIPLILLIILFSWGIFYYAGMSGDINPNFAFTVYFISIASLVVFLFDNLLAKFTPPLVNKK